MAILMVMLLHFGETYQVWDRGPLVWLVGPSWAWAILGWGNFAVTMFFVISGFLITTTTIERTGALRHTNLRAFYVRRAARILPCLFLAVTVIAALGLSEVPSFRGDGPRPDYEVIVGAISVLGFFHNILMQKLGYFDYCLNVYWSLSVEEVFYIGFPLVCVFLKRDLLFTGACAAFIVAAPFYRAAHADNDIFYLYANLACFDAISIGCLAALLAQRWQPDRRLTSAMHVAGWLALTGFWLRGFGGHHKALSFTCVALSTAAIILGSLKSERRVSAEHFAGRAIRWLGRHSYELYLFHIIVLAGMRDAVPGASLAPIWQIPWLLAYLALGSSAAAVIARFVSGPANRALRSRLFASPVRGNSASAKNEAVPPCG